MNIINFKLLESRLELYFQAQGIDIEVSNKKDCLKILLESENTPSKKECISLIKRIITDSPKNRIDIIKVYGRKKHEYSPEWNKELIIDRETVLDFKLLESKLELYFQIKGIDIEISSKDNGLQILLESKAAPKQKQCLSLIEQILVDSQESKIDSLEVYGRKKSEDFPEWTEKFTIDNETHTDINRLAKQRNIESIVSVLSRDLNTNSIEIKPSWQDDCLRIMLICEQRVDKDLAFKIKNKIFDLNIDNCQKLKVCSQQINDNFPDWLEEFYNIESQSAEVKNQSVADSSTKSKLALAKQGDPDAIAYCLNYLFQKRQIITTAIVVNNWLEITVQANKTPDRDFLVPYITNFVQKLQITHIDTLQIHAGQKGETFQSWNKTISLNLI